MGAEPTRRNIFSEIQALEEKLSELRRELFSAPLSWSEEDTVSLLLFRIRQETFALFLSDVTEVMRMVKAVTLPKAPAGIEGVINCRGVMLPLFNPGLLLSAEPMLPHLSSSLIVVTAGGQQIAL